MAYRLTFYGMSETPIEQVIEDREEAHATWDRTVANMANGVADCSYVTFADGGAITKQHAGTPRQPDPEPEPVVEEAPKATAKKK